MSQCKSCGANIKWVKTMRGKNMPVDEDSVGVSDCEDGDLLITESGRTFRVGEQNPPQELLYVSHWSTCPKADSHRSPK